MTRTSQNIGPPVKGGPGGLVLHHAPFQHPGPLRDGPWLKEAYARARGQHLGSRRRLLDQYRALFPSKRVRLTEEVRMCLLQGSQYLPPENRTCRAKTTLPNLIRAVKTLERARLFQHPKAFISQPLPKIPIYTPHRFRSDENRHTTRKHFYVDLRGPRPLRNASLAGSSKMKNHSKVSVDPHLPLQEVGRVIATSTYLQQLDTTPTAPSRARQSTTSTPSKLSAGTDLRQIKNSHAGRKDQKPLTTRLGL
jgi:hypothetical protein